MTRGGRHQRLLGTKARRWINCVGRAAVLPSLLGLLYLGVTSVGPAFAFTQITITAPGGGPARAHWNAMDFPIPFVLHDAGSIHVPDTSEFDVIRAAFQSWENVATAAVSFQDDGLSADSTIGNDGIQRVVFVENDPDMGGTSILGLASLTYSTVDGHIIEADIRFNEDHVFDTSGSPPGGAIDLQSLAAHEVGHLLGLDHTFLTAATMYPFYDPQQFSPAQDDIAGISSIYPDPSFFSTTGRISGDVRTLVTDRPLMGVGVIAWEALGPTPVVSAVTDENGAYVLPGLTAGDHYVQLQPVLTEHLRDYLQDAHTDFDPVFYDDAVDVFSATAINVTIGGETGEINFELIDRVDYAQFDGEVETYVFLTSPAGATDYFAVRLEELPLPQSFLLDALTFTNGVGAVSNYRVMVTGDNGGVPNLGAPLVEVSGIVASAFEQVTVDLGQVPVDPREELWVVVHMPVGQPASLGTDTDGIDSDPPFGLVPFSFVSSNGTTFSPLMLSGSAANLGLALSVLPLEPTPGPRVASLTPDRLTQGETTSVSVFGENIHDGADASFGGSGITVDSVSYLGPTQLDLQITVDPVAATGLRDLTVINPDGKSWLHRSVLTVLPALSSTEILIAEVTPALVGGADSVLVGVKLLNTVDIGGFRFRLHYDPAVMTPLNPSGNQGVAVPSERSASFEILGVTLIAPGELLCTGIADLADAIEQPSLPPGDGTVVRLGFAVPPAAQLESYPLTLSDADLSDGTGSTLILPTLVAGMLELRDWIVGDLNMDSLPYTIADAVTSVSALLGSITLDPLQTLASDVNDDGATNTIADTVFLINVLLNFEEPLGKNAPVQAARVELLEIGNGIFELRGVFPAAAGGAWASLELDPGVRGVAVESMDGDLPSMQWDRTGDRLRVLWVDLAGKRIPAGHHLLARLRIDGGAARPRLGEIELSDIHGRTAPVEFDRTSAPRLPTVVSLGRPVPNPFNPSTVLEVALPASCRARLNIYDSRGRVVIELLDEELAAGVWPVRWDGLDAGGRTVASGVYYAVLRACARNTSRKLTLLK